jgi:oxygen-independent coproporphyrinogen-3 oxidase
MFRKTHSFLGEHGYDHYEISNFSKPGFQCRHNLIYWQRQPFIGIGAGAHSFTARSWGERWASPADLGDYSNALEKGQDPARCLEVFSRGKAMSETLYLGLRTAEGVREEDFLRCFGVKVGDAYTEVLDSVGDSLHLVNGCWRMSLDGWLIYDFLIQKFL